MHPQLRRGRGCAVGKPAIEILPGCLRQAVRFGIPLEDAVRADAIFNVLMGEDVDPRRDWIESNAKHVNNLDI